MVKGLERRSATETNDHRSLEAMATVKPVSLPQTAGPAASPRLPRVNVTQTVGQRVANKFSKYVSGELDQAAQIEHQRSLIDGQMAAQQGKTFDAVQMDGDKWALEGYRLVEAQQLASTLLTAQRAEIAQGMYESDPDTYRAHFMNRAEGVLKTAGDSRTAELAREQLLKQMPVLVEDQMVQHLQWKEEKNFQTLVQAVDTVSMDPTSSESLISFATGGEGSATAGLSEARRRDAVVAGIENAFYNDNPQAYAVLAGQGLLKELPRPLRQKIDAARRQYEQRRRTEYNAEFIQQEDELMNTIATGNLEPAQAMVAYENLLAEHDMRITQSEAGAIYQQAQSGVRERRINTATATQEAMVRGDREAAVYSIRQSLTRTESGGQADAYRTNQDGRSYAGLLQMGAGRLQDYARATGTTALTPSAYGALTEEEQRVVEDWHINDILDRVEAKGYDNLVGQSINGVSITYSGLVAVAHLGGAGGLDKFISSGGKYNPQDELGTSLTDYLRTHGNGVTIDLSTQTAQARARMEAVREHAAVETFESMQPQLDAVDDAYKNAGITEEVWRAARQDIRSQYGVAKTMADAKYEMGLTQEVLDAAQAQKAEGDEFASGVRLAAAADSFERVAAAFERGEVSREELDAAQGVMLEERINAQREHGIEISGQTEAGKVRDTANRVSAAVEKRLQFDQEQMEISTAIASGTLDELPKALQDRAIKQFTEQATRAVQEASAGQPDFDAAGAMDAQMLDFYASSGVVDPSRERVMNGYLAGGPIDRNGEPRVEYVEAANDYRALLQRNPELADKYVRPEHRAALDAIVEMADSGPLEGAVRTIGVQQSQAPGAQKTEDFLADPDVMSDIDEAVDRFLKREEVGIAQVASPWRNAEMQQLTNRSWFDIYSPTSDENKEVLRERLVTALGKEHKRQPMLAPDQLVSAATRRVTARTPVVGNWAVPLPMDGPSMGERMFGARAADMQDIDNVYNDAVFDYLRSDEFVEQYPYINQTGIQEALPNWVPEEVSILGMDIPIRGSGGPRGTRGTTNWTGVRPFQPYYDKATDEVYIQVLSQEGGFHAPVVLPLRQIGKSYINKQTALAAGR